VFRVALALRGVSRAEMDLIAVASACRMNLLPINGADAVPRSLSVSVSAA
tara:strand:- start:318 stop:467 length:150 start_codon:yes stop_codon:yes gene_type:complete